jgi:SNF2 family DNA or RNA helicase
MRKFYANPFTAPRNLTMFGALRRTFGLIKVTETADQIEVSGVPAEVIQRDISKIWNSSRINTFMFTSVNRNGFKFPKFFAVEIHYMLGQIDEYRYSKTSVRTIRHILQELEENTWLKNIHEEQPARLNLSRLHDLTINLMPHQNGFLEVYNQLPSKYGLNGYLLSADPGTGKTFMGLAVSHCLEADLTVIVSPKNALERVWGDSIKKVFKHPKGFWMANSGVPYKREPIIVTNYEALPKAVEAGRHAPHSKAAVILDESHNLNEAKSNRTKAFLELCKAVNTHDVLWSSGSPLKAMGYEMVPLLRSIDPLFTQDVEMRFVKIFGKESGRALDILRNRIGKVSFHVSAAEVVANESTTTSVKIQIPNGNDFTLDTIREKMKFYMDHFKNYRTDYDNGIREFERVMSPDQKDDFRRYEKAIKEIARGYDPVAHKEIAEFANRFENKVIIPAIQDKNVRDKFRESKSVIKYVKLKVVGEALAQIVGKTRMQCHLEMVKHIDWKGICEKSEKKVLIFTSYVEVLKAIGEELGRLGIGHILVYGDTNSNVAGLIKQFGEDEKIKASVATYMSLSTAVPITMANTTVFTNVPFRSFELKQAKARTDRLGQDSPVHFVFTTLDTGEEPNISTRSHDILEWSERMVAAMLGGEHIDGGIAAELNKNYMAGAMEHYQEPGTMFEHVFQDLYQYAGEMVPFSFTV